MTSNFREEKRKRKLELLLKKEEEESVQILSKKYGIPYVDLSLFPVELDALKVIPGDKARLGELAVFQIVGRRLKIALRNPAKEETALILKKLKEERYECELFLASRRGLERAWENYLRVKEKEAVPAGVIQVSNEKIAELRKQITNIREIKDRIEQTFHSRTTEALEIILAGALAADASDVHMEPQEADVRLRLRLDGMLIDLTTLPTKLYTLLLSRIKLISELKLNIRDRAQDGRFTIKTDETDVEVRTSTLPGPYGENVVLRVLNPKTIQVPYEKLGMQPWVVKTMEEELKKPNGMILTTGPTGSGKTTTLYAFLRKIHTPEIKIITIEDPIEYHLTGVEQTNVDQEKGYDFANGLRSILRQDPDVILVGEIRDLETAETAMHASLTGHLVFSTLHTNNAAGTIPRLLDLGVKPAIIAPAINVAMAQRLVRKLCEHCRIKEKIGEEFKKRLEAELAGFPPGIAPPPKRWTIFKASETGCSSCNNLGYKGRVGVFEIILIDSEVEKLILRDPSEFEIKKTAEQQGQITMRQDGLLKVLAGITDFAELERVVGSG